MVEATGREHLGQSGPIQHSHDDALRCRLPQPNSRFVMGTYTESYDYDEVGNLLEMGHVGNGRSPSRAGRWKRTYDYAETSLLEDGTGATSRKSSNRLSSTIVGNGASITERYQYDAHGNMTRMPHLGGAHPGPNLHWDHLDQLRQADLGGGGTAYFVYDASGQRVRKVWEKSTTLVEERIYLSGFEIFRRRSGADVLERESLHIMDDTQRVAIVETRTIDSAGADQAPRELIRFQFGNHLGSASLELDHKAKVISYEEYSPYGSTTYQAVRSQTETPKCYRYTGKERDQETGLYYYGARYYAPWLAQWTSCDSIRSINRYEFVEGKPTIAVDIGGLASNRQLLGLDEDSVDIALAKDPSLGSITRLTAKRSAYDLWNLTTGGFVAKQDLLEERPASTLREGEYLAKTVGEASKSLLILSVSLALGGPAATGTKTLASQLARGAATGAVTGATVEAATQSIEGAIETRDKYDLGAISSAGVFGAAFGAAAAGPALLAGLKRVFRRQITPEDFGLRFIASDSQLGKIWDDALAHVMALGKKNAATKLRDNIAAGTASSLTVKELRAAFSTVRDEFRLRAGEAGLNLAGQEIHHWNYPMVENFLEVLNSERLVVAPRRIHDYLHEATAAWIDPTTKQRFMWISPLKKNGVRTDLSQVNP